MNFPQIQFLETDDGGGEKGHRSAQHSPQAFVTGQKIRGPSKHWKIYGFGDWSVFVMTSVFLSLFLSHPSDELLYISGEEGVTDILP